MKNTFTFLTVVVLLFWFSINSWAALVDRGNEVIYDSDLNITWLKDTKLSATETFGVSGINNLGVMEWNVAQNWISAMNAANYLGISSWRLPICPTDPPERCFSGEMLHLNSTELGNVPGNFTNPGPFISLDRFYVGFYGVEKGPDNSWRHLFNQGVDHWGTKYQSFWAWPVADGDVIPAVVQVDIDIDIKPGSDPNSINLCSNGAVPIAIFGSETFDVYEINTETLRFAEATVKVVGRKDPHSLCSYEDVNDDIYYDLVCHFVTADVAGIDGESSTATVNGELLDGTPFEGTDSVNIVKDTCI